MTHLTYALIRSRRRTLSLQINRHGELIARAPLRMSIDFIEDFIEKKRDWIEKNQERMKSQAGSLRRKEYTDEEIKLMKNKLSAYIIPRIHELSEGKHLPKITSIKITKSNHRWGSCSAKNGLCFSYRLAEYLKSPPDKGGCPLGQGGSVSDKSEQTPLNSPLSGGSETIIPLPFSGKLEVINSPFIDAIIIHELAHLREKNHQKPFWNLVYSMMPEYEEVMKNIKSTNM